MLSFDNTEIAFECKTNQELRKAHFLFGLLGKKWMVAMGKSLTHFSFSIGLPVKGIIKSTIFKQFVGGESIEECETTLKTLGKYHIGTILDYSVEGKEEESSFEAAIKEILRTVEKAKQDDRIPFCVFKVTGLGSHYILDKKSSGAPFTQEDYENWNRVKSRVHTICEAAFKVSQPIFIDAEESWIQPAIDELALDMMRLFNKEKCIVYNTAQLYRHDRLAYIQSLHSLAVQENFFIGLKLVRGAYMEKERARAIEKGYPDPIQPNKEATDKDFDAAVEFCLNHIDRIAICAGTHNELSSFKLSQDMLTRQLPLATSHVYFAQLLGMSDHISFNLSRAGYNVAKYVPYGPVKDVVPYLIRRAEENTSVKGQTGRELSLIKKELDRRRV